MVMVSITQQGNASMWHIKTDLTPVSWVNIPCKRPGGIGATQIFGWKRPSAEADQASLGKHRALRRRVRSSSPPLSCRSHSSRGGLEGPVTGVSGCVAGAKSGEDEPWLHSRQAANVSKRHLRAVGKRTLSVGSSHRCSEGKGSPLIPKMKALDLQREFTVGLLIQHNG